MPYGMPPARLHYSRRLPSALAPLHIWSTEQESNLPSGGCNPEPYRLATGAYFLAQGQGIEPCLAVLETAARSHRALYGDDRPIRNSVGALSPRGVRTRGRA